MDLGRAVLFPGQRAELPPCHQCREHFAAQISLPRFFLCFREFEKEPGPQKDIPVVATDHWELKRANEKMVQQMASH